MAKSASPPSASDEAATAAAAADAVRAGGRQIVVTSSGDVPGLDALAAAEGSSSSSSSLSSSASSPSSPYLLQGAAALSRVHQLQSAASPAPRAWAGVARFVLWSLVALAAATLVPAQLVGASGHTGSIAVGKDADLALIAGDPSRNVGDLRHTRMVMLGGQLMDADDLRTAAGFSGRPL